MIEILETKTFEPTFDYTPLELQALKVCEEAWEVYQAAKHLHDFDFINDEKVRMWDLRTEMADVHQALFNLADMIALTKEDIEDDMYACYTRNVCRGRVK